MWLVLLLSALALSGFMISRTMTDWRARQVITTLATLTKPVQGGKYIRTVNFSLPVAEIEFPTVTICGSGQHLGQVKRVLYQNFTVWNGERNQVEYQTEAEEAVAFRQFLLEVYRVRNGTNLVDILSTMISPDRYGFEARNLIRHELTCTAPEKVQTMAKTRKKRQPAILKKAKGSLSLKYWLIVEHIF